MDHCRIVLRALAHFHAYSTIIQRDSEEPLLDLWPFAVEASNFREVWAARMRPVKEQVGGWRLGRPRLTPRCVGRCASTSCGGSHDQKTKSVQRWRKKLRMQSRCG